MLRPFYYHAFERINLTKNSIYVKNKRYAAYKFIAKGNFFS